MSAILIIQLILISFFNFLSQGQVIEEAQEKHHNPYIIKIDPPKTLCYDSSAKCIKRTHKIKICQQGLCKQGKACLSSFKFSESCEGKWSVRKTQIWSENEVTVSFARKHDKVIKILSNSQGFEPSPLSGGFCESGKRSVVSGCAPKEGKLFDWGLICIPPATLIGNQCIAPQLTCGELIEQPNNLCCKQNYKMCELDNRKCVKQDHHCTINENGSLVGCPIGTKICGTSCVDLGDVCVYSEGKFYPCTPGYEKICCANCLNNEYICYKNDDGSCLPLPFWVKPCGQHQTYTPSTQICLENDKICPLNLPYPCSTGCCAQVESFGLVEMHTLINIHQSIKTFVLATPDACPHKLGGVCITSTIYNTQILGDIPFYGSHLKDGFTITGVKNSFNFIIKECAELASFISIIEGAYACVGLPSACLATIEASYKAGIEILRECARPRLMPELYVMTGIAEYYLLNRFHEHLRIVYNPSSNNGVATTIFGVPIKCNCPLKMEPIVCLMDQGLVKCVACSKSWLLCKAAAYLD